MAYETFDKERDEQAAVEAEPSATAETLAGPVDELHRAVSSALARRVGEEGEDIVALEAEAFSGGGNIVGVGIGRSTLTTGFSALAAPPGDRSLIVYLVEPMEDTAVRGALAKDLGVEAADTPIEAVVTGEISALAHTFRMRPAPGGVSVGHHTIGAGTLGCLCRGRSGDRAERLLVLSNNHVLAAGNAGTFGDPIWQPGRLDGGSASDQIAALERFAPIDFSGGPNLVDCATGWADPDLVRSEIVYLAGGTPSFFRLGAGVEPCAEGLEVSKSGRTTQLTHGRVFDCSATVRVRFEARTALFSDQVAVAGTQGDFSRPGDSGSVVFSGDDRRLPVGLLFAGGMGTTFANKIDRVLAQLDIELVT